jgi:hypothetical protein
MSVHHTPKLITFANGTQILGGVLNPNINFGDATYHSGSITGTRSEKGFLRIGRPVSFTYSNGFVTMNPWPENSKPNQNVTIARRRIMSITDIEIKLRQKYSSTILWAEEPQYGKSL